jgi:hypothetical protein
MSKLTPAEHVARHQELHRMLDELFADYILHHPDEHAFLQMPLEKLLEWSHAQTITPCDDPDTALSPYQLARIKMSVPHQELADWLYEFTRVPERGVILLGIMCGAAADFPEWTYWEILTVAKERWDETVVS